MQILQIHPGTTILEKGGRASQREQLLRGNMKAMGGGAGTPTIGVTQAAPIETPHPVVAKAKKAKEKARARRKAKAKVLSMARVKA